MSSPAISVHIVPAPHKGLDIYFNYNDERLISRDRRLPTSLKYRFYDAGVYGVSTEEKLNRFLREYGNYYALYIHTEFGVTQAKWDHKSDIVGKLRTSIQGDVIRIEKKGFEGQEPVEGPLLRIGQSFILNSRTGALSKLCAAGWDQLHQINESDICPPYFFQLTSVEMPVETFNQNGYLLIGDHMGNDLLWDNQEPQSAAADWTLVASPTEDDTCVSLNIQVSYEDVILSFPSELFKELLAALSNPICTSVRRRTIIFTSILGLPTCTSEADIVALMDDMLYQTDLDKPAHRNQIKPLLIGFYRRFLAPAAQLIVSSQTLMSIDANFLKLLRILYELHRLLDSPIISGPPPWQMPRDRFFQILPRLHSVLSKFGMQLKFDQKPVLQVPFSIQVDIQQTGQIDWFELTADIYHEGGTITAKEWSLLFATQYIEGKDAFYLADTQFLSEMARMNQLLDNSPEKPDAPKRLSRLQLIEWLMLKKLGVQVNLAPEYTAIFDRLLHFNQIEEVDLPTHFKGVLRDYQKNGFEWLWFLYNHRFGACLADDMGLGKTVQAIIFLAKVSEQRPPSDKKRPHLIVVPASLVFNWQAEIETFYPNLSIHDYTGSKRTLEHNADIILTTYDYLRQDIHRFLDHEFEVIIFDEAQLLKNMNSSRSAAARQVQGNFKLCLTGTPLENHVGEYATIMQTALPGLLDDLSPTAEGYQENLLQRTKPFVLRRTKQEILTQLPEKLENTLFLDLSTGQKALYTQLISEFRQTVGRAYEEQTRSKATMIALTAILRLRQLCIAPQLIDPESKEPSPKIDYLISKVKELATEGHAALIFTQFTSVLDLIEPYFIAENLPYFRLDGKVPTSKRQALVKAFQESEESAFFLMSLKAGGIGLNLTRASYVFHLDPWWNPAVENQASDRAHRLGQTQPVFIIKPVMRHSIEEKILALKAKKEALYQAILNQAYGAKNVSLSQKDFEYLLSA